MNTSYCCTRCRAGSGDIGRRGSTSSPTAEVKITHRHNHGTDERTSVEFDTYEVLDPWDCTAPAS